MTDLTSLYRGALIGQALSKQLGAAEATGSDIGQAQRAAVLQAGVASGKVKAASLSPQDSALLSTALTVPKVPSPVGGGGILDVLATPFKMLVNTGGDLVKATESLPAGLKQLAESTYKTAAEIDPTNNQKLKGPDLLGLGAQIAKSTVHDFTHFDPMHPLYPALDIAAVASGGASALVRGGGAVSRLAATGRAAEAGADVSKIGGVLGRAVPESVAKSGQRLAKLGSVERPAVPITAAATPPGVVVPPLPIRHYSISPFRKLAVEKPIEALFTKSIPSFVPFIGGKFPAGAAIPGLSKGTSLVDLRGAYHVRKAMNVERGRASATSTGRAVTESQGFNKAVQGVLDTSANDTQALEKINALVLLRELAAENMTPDERLDVLEQYRDRTFTGTPPYIEGVAMTPETKEIREFNRKLTGTAEFRKYFSEPDAAILKVRDEWDKALLAGQKALNLDPHEILQRSLGPAAYIRAKTPEELLREQPANVQASMNFAMKAHEIEQALRESGGAEVPELALIPQLAQHLPGTGTLQEKIALTRQAVESLRADIAGEHTPRELLNNAENTGYLPGNNLAQKVASQLPERLGVPEHVAEPFASGGLTNYFPQVSALPNMHVRPNGGPISRSLSRLTRGQLGKESGKLGLHEFKRENTSRLLSSNAIGVAPFASFLEGADLNAFKAGIDRRDPVIMVRHIAQRERVLVHRLLSEPFLKRILVKDDKGNPLMAGSTQELQELFNSRDAAAKYTIISPKALQAMVQFEDKAALNLADALKTEGKVTAQLMSHVDRVVDEGAQGLVRQMADEVIDTKGKGYIVPNSYVENFIKHARVLDRGNRVTNVWQGFINKWRTAVLAYMPSWLLRTSVGHGFVIFLSGVWDPRHYLQATNYFGEGFKIPGKDVHLSRGLNREIPAGIEQGMPHSEFGQVGQNQYAKNMIAPAITGAVHTVNNFQRRAAFLATFNRQVKQHMAELGEAFEVPGGLRNAKNLDKAIADHPDLVHHTLNELDRITYTFGQMSPWERRLAKNIIPFWGWYKFISKFVWSLPLTFPGRTLAITRLGQVGAYGQDNLGPMPDWLRASIMFDTHDLSKVHYISMLGLNPLGDVANPANGIQGIIRLGQMSPVIQAGLEAAGYNPMTGGLESIDPATGIVEVNGKFVNIHTGKEYDTPGEASVAGDIERFFGGLARSFPEIRIGELARTKGYPVYPESLPFIMEHRIPTTNPKAVGVPNILAQYAGVAPKTYNIQKYQQNLLKDIRRAMATSRKQTAKEKALP